LTNKATARTTAGLTVAMFDELDKLRNGHSTAQQAMAVAALARVIVATKRLELDVARFETGDKPIREVTA
jgi:hypothetical protein